MDNTSAVAYSGFIYVAGGKDGGGSATNKTYRLDPVANTWDDAAIADLPATRAETAGDMLNGRWILAGGRDTFGQLAGRGGLGPGGQCLDHGERHAHAGLRAGRGHGQRGALRGGRRCLWPRGPDTGATPKHRPAPRRPPALRAHQYPHPHPDHHADADPVPLRPAWITLTPYPAPVSNHAVAALNGALYSFGGITTRTRTLAYRYDPGPNQWTALAALPQARSGGQRRERRHLHLHPGRQHRRQPDQYPLPL